ncbi:MAG: NAD-dependent epimerase/dehydratase family protein [Candidatus Kapabacteria bacterium]|nr:NAD-dependent epimerase/dehydratase family protein [Ignavibacteriota bacterium]MCW5883721.1 NAD-dependent epimerase/dehydratase family protein [Candidatus Kapabacteria bacterium]
MKKILVTGALGQIGTELVVALRTKYGAENVIASDIRQIPNHILSEGGPFVVLDVTKPDDIRRIIIKYDIDTIFHLAAILSAVGERDPNLCWNVNMNGTINILDMSVRYELSRIIVPSSIAVWGKGVPKYDVPQESVLKPTSMYGVTKVAGELLCDYYVSKYGLDCRGLRYPGIISSETLPGGGTTDYAVEIFYEAVKNNYYNCFLREDTELPMMYMPDCIKATIDLAEAEYSKLVHHSDFNVASMTFDPKILADEIRKHQPDFKIDYNPDYRQAIADSWPASIDDSSARDEWGWSPSYDLASMTKDMLEKLHIKHKDGLI